MQQLNYGSAPRAGRVINPLEVSPLPIIRAKHKEADPNGKALNTPGAKADAGKVRLDLILRDMPRALLAVAEVGTFGANKYTEGGWLEVPDGFRRYEGAQMRHANSRHRGEILDQESKLYHLSHEAWNAMAKLELFLLQEEGKANPEAG